MQQPILKRFGMENRGPQREMPALVEGRYRIESQIGYGAFGKVFRARDSVTGEAVAVKLFDERLDETGYLQELGLLFSEEHEGIVRTLSFGYAAGRKYIVYEFIRGGSLRDLLLRTPHVPVEQALSITRDVCAALAFAHSRRVVHRDMKPENLLLTEPDWPFRAKLCDFGLSTRFRPGDRISSYFGSPAYMAPEQFGQSYDHRVDVYAAGVILYEMLFGRRPHAGDAVSLRHAHIHVHPPLPKDGPPELLSVLTRMMAKNPDERFSTAAEATEAIDELLAGLAETAGIPIAPPVFQLVQLHPQWSVRLQGGCMTWMPTADSGMLLSLRDQIVAVGADGSARALVETQVPVTEFVEGGNPTHLFAWVVGHDIWVWESGDVRMLADGAEAPSGSRRLVLSRDGRFLLISSPTHVDLASTESGEILWRAEVATYGAPPEVCFAGNSDLVWIGSESPRTQLILLNAAGERLCRTTAPGSDVVMIPADETGAVVVGCRGKRTLQRMSHEGFVSHTLELGASLMELHIVDERLAAAWSARHIELFDRRTLASYALLSRPDENEILLSAGKGLFTLEPEPASLVIRRLEMERTSLEGAR